MRSLALFLALVLFALPAFAESTYKSVFDVADAGYRHWTVLGCELGLMLVFGSLFFGEVSFPHFWLPKRAAVFGHGMGFFVVCFATIYTLVTTSYDYIAARVALANGHYSVVQGRITDFKPIPPEKPGAPPRTGYERFTVQGKTFSYSEYETTAGFNQTKRAGNQLENGMPVRVTYIDKNNNEILRLEVAQ